jgi:hypothetical protein
VLAFLGNMLRQLGKEIQSTEDLEVPTWTTSQILTSGPRKTPAFVFLCTVDDGATLGEPNNAGQAEWTSQDVLCQALEAEGVARRQVDAVVNAKTRVLPGTNSLDRPLADLFRRKQQTKDVRLPDWEQTVRVDSRQSDKRAIWGKAAIGCDGVDMAMEVEQLAKRLDAGDHARKDIRTPQLTAVDFDNRFPGGAGKIAQQRAVVPEVEAKAFGDGEDKLPVGDGRTN